MNKEEKEIVLVVEDEETLSQAIGKKLELNGFEVHKARSSEEAIKELNTHNKIYAIWLDHYLLGDDTGFDFVVKLKENKKFRHIPVFVVSNTASSNKVNSYLELGVNQFYTKSNHKLEDIIEDIKNIEGTK